MKKPIILSLIYTSVMALGWVLNPYEYGKIDNVIFMIPFLIALAVFSLLFIKGNYLKPVKIKNDPTIWMFMIVIL